MSGGRLRGVLAVLRAAAAAASARSRGPSHAAARNPMHAACGSSHLRAGPPVAAPSPCPATTPPPTLQGFMPEQLDQFAQDVVLPAFTPTLGLFLAISTGYGLWKVGHSLVWRWWQYRRLWLTPIFPRLPACPPRRHGRRLRRASEGRPWRRRVVYRGVWARQRLERGQWRGCVELDAAGLAWPGHG